MKPTILILILIAALAVSGCTGVHDEEYVKSTNGKLYRLEWVAGKVYYVKEVGHEVMLTNDTIK